MNPIHPLPPKKLYQRCDPGQFEFETTQDLETLEGLIGQSRAVEAVQFGIGIRREGYNLYVLGPHGTGKHTAVTQFLQQQAATESPPPDWCYVNNFEQPYKPHAIRLPAGQGCMLQRDIERLVQELHTAIPATFDSEEYRSRRKALEEEFNQKQDHVFKDMQQRARQENFTLIRTQEGMGFAPLQDGEVIKPEAYQKLPAEEQNDIENRLSSLQQDMASALRNMQKLVREYREKVRELDQETATFAVGHLLEELRQKYDEYPNVVAYLNAMQQEIVDNVDDFRKKDEAQTEEPVPVPLPRPLQTAPAMRRYQVNVLVDHSHTKGSPVMYQDHPTYPNLVGRIENLMSQAGTLTTDFTLIKGGALHQANGGYLILDARKVLMQPYAWDALKRVLRAGEITLESMGQQLGMVNTISLEPEPIPLDIKIVLIGERMLYYMLCQLDPDFNELFKVAVDFEEEMVRSPANNLLYAKLIGTLAHKESLRHLNREAVARIIEYSARLVGDSERLSTRMQVIADLLREADYWSGQKGNGVVTAGDVQKAIDAQIYRAGRIKERMQEEIERGTILIDTADATVGQVNGLSVISLGQIAFGRPSRITARVWLGRGKVVDIEREVELGGPLHSKGVLILTGYLSARYAPNRPLSLTASLVFEQSYGGVDGDSASSAELYALLSALANLPIKQSLAVTGSVNQRGQVQAIGGVNEKIEGFFDLCRARGLTGEHGVLIPRTNVKHLMLRDDVVQAAAEGQFHIYPVATIDQGLEILTGMPAGQRGEAGRFPEGSVNRRVEARLIELSERWQALSQNDKTR